MNKDSLPLELELRVSGPCDRFETAWKAALAGGPPPRMEEFLTDHEEPVFSALLRELFKLEIEYRHQHGQRPTPADYRFPGHESLLEDLFREATAAESTLSRTGAPPSRTGARAAKLLNLEEYDMVGERNGVGVWYEPKKNRPNLEGYEILGVLGAGGMGVVYKARQARLSRLVALKMIRDCVVSPEAMERFRFEAESLGRLNHPHIVQIYDVGEHQGHPFFSMEFVEGGTLAREIGGDPQDPVRSAVLLDTVARAAHAAHQRGIVHRDLKPGNVLITLEGTPKIADFGLAKQRDDVAWLACLGAMPRGPVIGTPEYMAPEQALGRLQDVAPGTDVYALGAILYKMMTGRPPIKGETLSDTLEMICDNEPIEPRRLLRTIPRPLENICLKCLRKDMSQRYPTALALAEDLHDFVQGKKWWQFWK